MMNTVTIPVSSVVEMILAVDALGVTVTGADAGTVVTAGHTRALCALVGQAAEWLAAVTGTVYAGVADNAGPNSAVISAAAPGAPVTADSVLVYTQCPARMATRTRLMVSALCWRVLSTVYQGRQPARAEACADMADSAAATAAYTDPLADVADIYLRPSWF